MKNQIPIITLPLMAVGVISCFSSEKDAEAPNVIYIYVDDLGYGDLSCYGQTHFSTPNIDLMASQGMKFTQHYAGCSVSAPSRCALLTGFDTGHTYVRGNSAVEGIDGKVYDTPIPTGTTTLGHIFKQGGYNTACIGKWGLGGIGSEGHPNNQGFDYFYGYLGQRYAHSYFPDFIHENSHEIELGKKYYSHDLIEDKAVEFITENRDNPFFLYLTFTLPHAELLIPDEYMISMGSQFKEKKPFNGGVTYSPQEKPRQTFASMVARLDKSVGRINELLKNLGIEENTLVIFTSDNGPHFEGGADPIYFNSSGGLRGIKRDLYEGGIRVPMIAKYPSVIKPNSTSDEAVAVWDMMPTFCDMIGVENVKGNGVSIVNVFKGENLSSRKTPLYWEFHEKGGRQAIRDGDWKLVVLNIQEPLETTYELYNIAQDPSESNNLLISEVEIAEDMKKRLVSARTESTIFKLFK